MKRQDDIDNELLKAFAFARLLPVRVNGYIGAGTGSLIIQAVIALTVGGLFALKIYWRRIKAFFTRKEADVEDLEQRKAEALSAVHAEADETSGEEAGTESIEAALLPEAAAVASEFDPAEPGAVEGEEGI